MGYIKLIAILTLLLGISMHAHAGGLGTLSQVGKSQEAMQRVLDRETKRYKAVKKGIEDGKLKIGDSQDTVRSRYGEPIIAFRDNKYAEKWGYKPGYASWFDKTKIYLFFDTNQKLAEIVNN